MNNTIKVIAIVGIGAIICHYYLKAKEKNKPAKSE